MSGTTSTLPPASQWAYGGLARVYDGIEIQMPGVSHAIVQLALWDAIEEFCYRSTYYRQTVAWTMPIGVFGYDFNPVDPFTLATTVMSVSGLNGMQIKPPAILIDPGDASVARNGVALLSCKPILLADSNPSLIIDYWNEALRFGAMARLYAQPSRPYSDEKRAAYYMGQFKAQIRLARAEATKFGDYGTWRYPYFSSGHQITTGFAVGTGANDGRVLPVTGPRPDINIPVVDGVFDPALWDKATWDTNKWQR